MMEMAVVGGFLMVEMAAIDEVTLGLFCLAKIFR